MKFTVENYLKQHNLVIENLKIHEIEKAINNNLEYVKSETLANAIQFNVQQEGGHEIFFDKLKTKIFITKV